MAPCFLSEAKNTEIGISRSLWQMRYGIEYFVDTVNIKFTFP